MKIDLRERSSWKVLGHCFTLVSAHFPKLFVINLIVTVPLFVLNFLIVQNATDPKTGEAIGAVVNLLLGVVLGPLGTGASIMIVSQTFTSKSYSIGDAFGAAFSRLGGLLAYGFCSGLIIGLGFLLLIVPGLIFLTWYYCGSVALMIEKLTFSDAMARSKSLSESFRRDLFGFAFVIGLIVIAIGAALGALMGIFIPVGWPQLIALILIQTAAATLTAVGPVIYYFYLRVQKEAFDLESLGSLVDAIAKRGGAAR